MGKVQLEITQESFGLCGDCMFLTPNRKQVFKHKVFDEIGCSLFNVQLFINFNETKVFSCDECDEAVTK